MFTSASHVQRFLSVHGVVLNLFPLGRHLDVIASISDGASGEPDPEQEEAKTVEHTSRTVMSGG